jgi:hypothetical protein
MHLHISFLKFVTCKKIKNVENDIVKFKLFSFSLKGKVKDWLLPMPDGSI